MKVIVPTRLQSEQFQISPDYCRISMAAALALGLRSGRVYRDAHCGCINLLENYPEGCYANCAYCGMARERPGTPEANTFIRVAWPVFETDRVIERIAEKEGSGTIGRVCISQVQDPRANADLMEIMARLRRACPSVPISALVNSTTLDESGLRAIQASGADIIGIGLDAASEAVFIQTRGKAVRSPHDWNYHWDMIHAARALFGPMKVNCHIVVGLGESDRDLIDLFYQLHAEQFAGYLFSFNPEPGSAMQAAPRPSLVRWRRIQLVKHLIEQTELPRQVLKFDEAGNLAGLDVLRTTLDAAIDSGIPFMTNGCPDRNNKMTCNRPYGSYRPSEEFRDYPFLPSGDDVKLIRDQLHLRDWGLDR